MTNEPIDPSLRALIRKKARQIIGRAGLTLSDFQDIEQQIYAQIAKYFDLGTLGAPRGALLATIVDRCIANILRERCAKRRHPRSICSLSIIVDFDEDDRPIDLAGTLSDYEHGTRLGRRGRSDQEMVELQCDMEVFLKKLSPRDREHCQKLMRDSPSQVARDLGIARTTFQDWLVRLQLRCIDDSLEEYV